MNKNDKETLIKENEKLKNEIIEFEKIQKDLEKQIKGKLWLWWFLPIFGLIIYMAIYQKRKSNDEYGPAILKIKTEITKNQFQILVNEKKLNQEENV